VNDQTQDPDSKVSARRRLIRGAFAAPAVLTMYSGGALAQASVTCVARAAQATPVIPGVATYTPPTPAPDTYMRIRLWLSTATQKYWLGYDQISAFTGALGIIATSGNYREFLVNTNSLSLTNKDVAASGVGTLTPSDRWVALRFDASGNLVGVGTTGDGTAITGSCWTSVY
jgi:hypothetical protein